MKNLKINSNLTKKISVSVLNQFASSGTNFILGIFLVRYLDPHNFGLYSIAYGTILFYSSIISAILITQMTIIAPTKGSGEIKSYIGNILIATICCGLTVIGVSIVLLFILSNILKYDESNVVSIIITTAIACTAYTTKDFFVRVSYNMNKEHWALILNTTMGATLLIQCTAAYKFKKILSASDILIFFSVAHIPVAVLGYYFIRPTVIKIKLKKILHDVREAWGQGKWGLATNIFLLARMQAHTFITAFLVGTTGVAEVNATRIIVTPAFLLVPSISQVIFPMLVDQKVTAPNQVFSTYKIFSILMVIIAVAYTFILMLFFKPIIIITIGSKYLESRGIVIAWCFYLIFSSGVEVSRLVSQIYNQFRFLFLSNCISFVTMCISLLFLYYLSFIKLPGIVYAMAIAECTNGILLYKTVLECERKSKIRLKQ